jgi:hypothetical protein
MQIIITDIMQMKILENRPVFLDIHEQFAVEMTKIIVEAALFTS